MQQFNDEPAEGVESGGPLSTLGDSVLPMNPGELEVPRICVNVLPLPRSDGYNHAVMVAEGTIRNMVAEEVERTLQTFLNGFIETPTYQNTPPRQDPNGLPGIQSHQLVRPVYDTPENKPVPVLKPEKKSLKNRLLGHLRRKQ